MALRSAIAFEEPFRRSDAACFRSQPWRIAAPPSDPGVAISEILRPPIP